MYVCCDADECLAVEEECPGYRRRNPLWYVAFATRVDSQEVLTRPVSQFTLFGQLNKGNKPSFHEAADAETARRVYDYFYQQLGKSYQPERVKNGVFQAMMDVELKNDGPVCRPMSVCFRSGSQQFSSLTTTISTGHHRARYEAPEEREEARGGQEPCTICSRAVGYMCNQRPYSSDHYTIIQQYRNPIDRQPHAFSFHNALFKKMLWQL